MIVYFGKESYSPHLLWNVERAYLVLVSTFSKAFGGVPTENLTRT